jgi:Ca2+-dependent lipid-binding protein
MLQLHLLDARKVPRMDWFGHSDPYIQVFVRQSEKHQTAVKTGSSKPNFDEKFNLPVHEPAYQQIRLLM